MVNWWWMVGNLASGGVSILPVHEETGLQGGD